jgi:hypothetical protein
MLIVARGVLILTAIAAAIYLICCVVLFAMQRSMIYQPQRHRSGPRLSPNSGAAVLKFALLIGPE